MFWQVISQENQRAKTRTSVTKWMLFSGETNVGCHRGQVGKIWNLIEDKQTSVIFNAPVKRYQMDNKVYSSWLPISRILVMTVKYSRMFSIVLFPTFSGVYNVKEEKPKDSERKMICQKNGMSLRKPRRFFRVSGSIIVLKCRAEGSTITHYCSRHPSGNESNVKEAA